MASVLVGGASDAELVHCALGGDAASLGVLLGRYRASLYARALGYLSQPEDAADAVQETFLLALTRLARCAIRRPSAAGCTLSSARCAPWSCAARPGASRQPSSAPKR